MNELNENFEEYFKQIESESDLLETLERLTQAGVLNDQNPLEMFFFIISYAPSEQLRKQIMALYMSILTKLAVEKQKEVLSNIAHVISKQKERELQFSLQLTCDMVADNYQKMSQDVQNHFKEQIAHTAVQNIDNMRNSTKEKELKISRMPSLPSTKFVVEAFTGNIKNSDNKFTKLINFENAIKTTFGVEFSNNLFAGMDIKNKLH